MDNKRNADNTNAYLASAVFLTPVRMLCSFGVPLPRKTNGRKPYGEHVGFCRIKGEINVMRDGEDTTYEIVQNILNMHWRGVCVCAGLVATPSAI